MYFPTTVPCYDINKSKKGAKLLNPNTFEHRIVQNMELFDNDDADGFDIQIDLKFCIDSNLEEF